MMALPFLQLAGAAVGAISGIRSGNLANNTAKANAGALETAAGAERAASVQREELQRQRARATIGTQLAAGAESGSALAGSDLDLLHQSLYNSEMDALGIRYEGLSKANNLDNEARQTRFRGKQARAGGYLTAAGTLLNGGASYLNAGGTLPNWGASSSTVGTMAGNGPSTVGMSY